MTLVNPNTGKEITPEHQKALFNKLQEILKEIAPLSCLSLSDLHSLYTHTMTRISDGEKYNKLAESIRAELDRRCDELIEKLKL